ncbi:MAG: DUF1330 domain-containing protein [Candidatus Promineifilaceae bacterium]
MYLTNQITPTREQFIDFMKNYPADEPVVMVNILKFKAKSDTGNESGAAAYARYGRNVAPLLKGVGGRVLWSGKVNATVIGDSENQPDMVMIVEYPSAAKFVEMSTSEAYRAVAHDRELSLTYGGLLASSTATLR